MEELNKQVENLSIDKTLINFSKCDIFTPDNISKSMSKFLHKDGNLLEPSVGEGDLLKHIELSDYSKIDAYDIKKEYINKCDKKNNIKYHCKDFIKEDIDTKYKNIILNPPFIRIQDLSEEYRKYVTDKWKILSGSFDIYYVFLLKCLDLLEENGGVMVSITPNSYLYNKSAKKIREHFIKNKYIEEIIDFKSKKVFPGVSTYCCITVFTKSEKDKLIYNDKEIKYSEISGDSLFSSTPGNKLGDICIFKNGVATLRDKIYIHEDKPFEEDCWKKLTNGREYKWILFPYNEETGDIIPEDRFKTNNPLSYQYLFENKEELSKRDKGNKKYEEWYAFGRKQSTKISKSEKLLYIPTFNDPENLKIKIDKPMIFQSCISIEIIEDGYTYEDISGYIMNNIEYISNNSSKRGGGWINISTSTLKKVPI